MTNEKLSKPKEQCHSFSDSFARLHGVKEAIILKFLAHKVRKSKKLHDGKKWHYDTLDELAKRFPYMSRSTLHEVLKRMAKDGLVEIGNYNRRKYDRTQWFTVPEKYMDAVEEDPRYFNVAVAESHGIAEAVLLANLDYWGRYKIWNTIQDIWQPMIPSVLAEIIPFSKSAIRRALKHLQKTELIIQKAPGTSLYASSEWFSRLKANLPEASAHQLGITESSG